MKVSLALSGGAARGAFHLGVIEALQDAGIEIGALSGTSIGAIIAVGIASGRTPQELLTFFTSKAFKKGLKWNSLSSGWFRITHTHALDQTLLSIAHLEQMSIPVHVCTMDLQNGEVIYAHQGETEPFLLASSALFPLFPLVKHAGRVLVDGGFRDNLPITPLKAYPYPIIAIDLYPKLDGLPQGFWATCKRLVYLSFTASSEQKRGQCDYYVSAQALQHFSLFRSHQLQACFDLGRETGRALVLTMRAQTGYNGTTL